MRHFTKSKKQLFEEFKTISTGLKRKRWTYKNLF